MKPLLRPARSLHPEVIIQKLGVGATTFKWNDQETFDRSRTNILRVIRDLVNAPGIFVRQEERTRGGSFMGTYEFNVVGKSGERHGSACLGYLPRQKQNGCLTLTLLWSSLPSDIECVVGAIDDIWHTGDFDCLYAYDALDHAMQNMEMIDGMEVYGLDPQQVECRPDVGIEVIETRYNPGYEEYRAGMLVSVQWLNYWSARAQGATLGDPRSSLPSGVELTTLPDGCVSLRLGKSPGRCDDVTFHELQLATRKALGLTQ